MVADYLSERILLYETDTGMKEYTITAGIPQGSVLGPFLWNVMYDGLLNLKLQDGARLIGYADDVALVVNQKCPELLRIIANDSISRCDRWLNENGLKLAASKTEAILITDRRAYKMPSLTIQQEDVSFKRSLTYLGVQLDGKLNFHEHADKTRDKALKTARTLARIMPNCRGPKDSIRRLINSVIHSQMMYAAPTIAVAFNGRYVVSQFQKPQRISALRVISAYRTVSTSAALVLAGLRPIDLMVKEREKIFHMSRTENLGPNAKEDAQQMSINAWQERWSNSETGRWTYRLIPNIRPWLERKHGNMNYFMTQIMTGHGNFNSYLYKFKLKEYKYCYECSYEDEDAEHNLFHCPKWEYERCQLNNKLQVVLTPENMVENMLISMEKWKLCEDFISTIMREKSRRMQNP